MRYIIIVLIFLLSYYLNSQTKLEKWNFILDMIDESPYCASETVGGTTWQIFYIEDDYETLRIKYLLRINSIDYEIVFDLKNKKKKKSGSLPFDFAVCNNRIISGDCNYCAVIKLTQTMNVKSFRYEGGERIFNGWNNMQALGFHFNSEFDRDKFIRYVSNISFD